MSNGLEENIRAAAGEVSRFDLRLKVQEMLTEYILQGGFAGFCKSQGVTVEQARAALNDLLYDAMRVEGDRN